MGKASSAKKVARAARAGGNRRSGQRRALGFPTAIGAVLILGLVLVAFARNERNSNAHPLVNTGAAGANGGDHWHEPYSIYTCVTDPSTPAEVSATSTTLPSDSSSSSSDSSSSSQTGLGVPAGHLDAAQTPSTDSTASDTTTTTDTTLPVTTDTTVPETSTTIAAAGDVPGEFQPFLQDAQQDVLGIHTHGDGVIHIHPFADSVAGRRATLDKFLTQVGARMTNDTLTLPTAAGGELVYQEGVTKCLGGKDGVLKVARWDSTKSAANGDKPNEIITSNFGSIRLKNGQAISISFLPDGSTIPIQKDVETRMQQLTDIPNETAATSSSSDSSASDSSSSDASASASSASDSVPVDTASSSSTSTSSSSP